MVYCAIYGCKNYWSKKNKVEKVRFFTFPKDGKISKQWIDVCGKKNEINQKWARICSEHFLDEDYRLQDILLNVPNDKKRLKKDAIPTKNLPIESNVSSSKSNRYTQRARKQIVENCLKGNIIDMDMPSSWNELNENLLIDLLKEREHIYNHNHPNYKTYNVTKECAIIAKLFKPSKTSKEILDKITLIKIDLANFRNLIETNDSNFYLPPLFEKCKFMYTALFGDIPSHILKINIKDAESKKNNDVFTLTSIGKKPNYFKRITPNKLEMINNPVYESENNTVCIENDSEKEITSNSNFGNNTEIQSLDELYEYDSFALNEDSVKEIGIQCNLYEDMLKDKIETIQFKDCTCYMEILKIIDSFKPIDANLELLKNEENNIPIDIKLIDDENSTIDSTYLNYEEFYLSNDEKDVKWSDFENVSNDDSSDYGLTEIPFPETPKLQKKTMEDRLILYECTICNNDFKTYYLFDRHYTKYHAERSQLCSICGRISSSFRRLQNHENHCNPNDNPYCYECNHVFKSKINYFDHFNIKHNKKKSPYICCCNRSFMKYTKFVFHLNKNHCGTINLCSIPSYTTKEFLETFLEMKSNKNDKIIVANNATEKEKLKFWCRICKTNFHNNRAYMAHFDKEYHSIIEKDWIEQYGIEEEFECEVCDKKMSEFSDLVKHRHKYHHKCTLDEYIKNLEYGPNLQDEPILITQPTNYSKINTICHICKKKFFMPTFELHFKEIEHINLEKKWLENHNIKEFNCFDCSINYVSLLDYLIHKKSEHNEWPTNILLKSIIGDIDDSIPDFLQDEINSKLIYKCSICNYYTKYKKVYIHHMLNHYPKKLFKCSCGKRFIYKDLLMHHRNKAGCQKEGCIIPRFVIQTNSFANANLI